MDHQEIRVVSKPPKTDRLRCGIGSTVLKGLYGSSFLPSRVSVITCSTSSPDRGIQNIRDVPIRERWRSNDTDRTLLSVSWAVSIASRTVEGVRCLGSSACPWQPGICALNSHVRDSKELNASWLLEPKTWPVSSTHTMCWIRE